MNNLCDFTAADEANIDDLLAVHGNHDAEFDEVTMMMNNYGLLLLVRILDRKPSMCGGEEKHLASIM